TLANIERRFADEPGGGIGVHSPKFEEEQGVERLREFLRDNRVRHPVAADATLAIWKAWGIGGRPSIVVLDAEGSAVWAASGEPDERELAGVITSVLGEARAAGRLAKGKLLGPRPEPDTSGPLRYPGKVLALADGGLAVADTGHDRVVVLDPKGQLR